MDYDIDRVADTQCEVGEGPIWQPDEQALYWCDIPRGAIHRYVPGDDEHEQVRSGPLVGGFTLQADGSLLLFGEHGRIREWDGSRTTTVLEEIPRERGGRFNDVVADPRGRVFAGTVSTDGRLGQLYRVESGVTYTAVETGLDLPNGIAFSPDLEHLYLTDSGQNTDMHSGRISKYDYDEATGTIDTRRTIVDVSHEEGLPDGLTVDADGDLWSARWNGGCLVRYSPDGTERERVDLPARKVTSAVFGGAEFEQLFVTTACPTQREEEGDGAGALFRFRPGVAGRPEFRSEIPVP